ncbi:MAG: hypothetical protein GF341_07440 [candidate division Zixibacteria bacterium]|nr:hypothetical protein [candidate division Zixibacteria bacterium]
MTSKHQCFRICRGFTIRSVILLMVLMTGILAFEQALAQDDPTPGQIAQQLLAREQIDSALAVLDSALTADSGNVSLQILKSDVLLLSADTSGAVAGLADILSGNPRISRVRTSLIRLLMSQRRSDSALQVVRSTPPRSYPRTPDDVILYGDVYRAAGISDTATVLYRRACHGLLGNKLPLPSIAAGLTFTQLTFEDGHGTDVIWRAGTATVFVFWATWSHPSESMLQETAGQVKKAAMTWDLVPVNVDAYDVTGAAALRERASSLGVKDTVLFDAQWDLVRHWKIDHLPCVVLMDYRGRIEEVVYGWDDAARERVLEGALGGLDTIGTVQEPAPPDTVRGRARNLLASARQAWYNKKPAQAVTLIGQAIRADSSYLEARVDQIIYRWNRGDTLGARLLSDQLNRRAGDLAWAHILSAYIADAHGRTDEAVTILQDTPPDTMNTATGLYRATVALLAARAGQWDVATSAREQCQNLNRFNPLLLTVDARLAERFQPDSAMVRWRRAAVDRLNRMAQ